MKQKKKMLLMLLLCFVVVLATACSGNVKSPVGKSDGSGSGDKKVEYVKIAALAPLSGAYAINGQNVIKGTEMAVEEINANGGIKSLGGAKFKLVTADTGSSDPSHAASVARRVIQENPDLTAMIGLWASSYTLAGSTVTEQAKIPLLSQSFTDEITARGYKYVFQFPAKASKMGELSVDYLLKAAKENNYEIKTMAVLSDNQSSNKTVGQTTAKKFRENGVNVPVEEYYKPGLTDATAISTKILNADPDLIYAAGALSDLSLIMKTLRGMGYKGTFLGSGAGYVLSQFNEATGDAGNGSFATAGWNWDFPYPGAKEFNQKYVEKYKEPFAPQEAGEDYAMVYALKAALEKAGTTDHEKVRDALSQVSIDSIMTGGHVSFDETGMNKDVEPVLIEWIDGKPRTIYPTNASSTKPIFNFEK
ncbi:MAG TPA: ABC transporter substrate-binding protein [Bacillales bacterium]|nr:ABC transporter substrate-binding protein [Bacillales bacterium]